MSATVQPKRVLVIGAGLTGLVAIKEALAEGHDVIAYEARDTVGGMWAYEEPNPSGKEPHQSPIYNGIVLNSCIYTSSFGDFPIDPARYPEFLPHRRHLQYLKEYAEHFDLERHIVLGMKVHSCRQTESGSWIVQAGGDASSPRSTQEFDAVMVCSGHHSKPHIPEILADPTTAGFKGRHFHSHYYRRPEGFADQNVVIVGLGNAALDIAVDLSSTARSVTLISRRGGWIIPRYAFGAPVEALDSRFGQTMVPHNLSQWVLLKILNLVVGEHPEELKPSHRILEQNPGLNSDIIERIRTGAVSVRRSGVEGFTETGLRLDDGSTIEADVVITATGYHPEYAFLPRDALDMSVQRDDSNAGYAAPRDDGKVDLYKLMVPPRYRNLYVMGLIEHPAPQHQSSEAQARWVSAAISGRIELPTPEGMVTEIAKFHDYQREHFVDSARHGISTIAIPYLDDLLRPLGADPTFGRLFGAVFSGRNGNRWEAFLVLMAVIFAIPVSCQWRLFGHGSRAELATATVLRVRDGGKKLSEREVSLLRQSGEPEGRAVNGV